MSCVRDEYKMTTIHSSAGHRFNLWVTKKDNTVNQIKLRIDGTEFEMDSSELGTLYMTIIEAMEEMNKGQTGNG